MRLFGLAAALLVVGGGVGISGEGREPYRSSSPFVGLYRFDGVTTTNDEYGISVYWRPDRWRLAYSGKAPFRDGEEEGLVIGIWASCRVDGGAEGHAGARPLRAELDLPMHPGDPDVPNVFHPLYWWRGLTGREFVRTPVRVQVEGAGVYRSELAEHTIDYSFARPGLTVELRAGAILGSLARGEGLVLSVEGGGNELGLSFGVGAMDCGPRPGRCSAIACLDAAAVRAGRCRQGGRGARLGGMTLTTPKSLFLAGAALAVALPLAAQQSDLKGNYDTKSGLITPALESGIDVQVVTTDSVPGKKCEALAGSEGYFPVMVLPTSGSLGGRTLADGAIRGMKTLREAAIEAGANAVLGLRSSPYVTRNGNPRMFLYGTLAVCE